MILAISHTWPDIKNAEYEVLQRLIKAATFAGHDVVAIDPNGAVVWFSPRLMLTRGKVLKRCQADLFLSLHFESPKVIDIYSYITLWQPLEFYTTFGYERTIKSLISHNDLISCDSDNADAHALSIFSAIGRNIEPLPRVYHTLPQPYLTSRITDEARLFYIGVNWERLGKEKGRFHDVLISLADKDLVDIYGPESLLGQAPWQGFPSYRGELPFDGEAIKYAINRAGICLALSSHAHAADGIMSNRLFEGIAGGAAVICNRNEFIDKHFNGELYLVDSSKGSSDLAMQITETIRRIRMDPLEAANRVQAAQEILKKKFDLTTNLSDLLSKHNFRRASYEASLAASNVTVILHLALHEFEFFGGLFESLASQIRTGIYLIVICREELRKQIDELFNASGCIKQVEFIYDVSQIYSNGLEEETAPPSRGPLTFDALGKVKTEFFSIVRAGERFFSDHFGRLASAAKRSSEALGASSSRVDCSITPSGKPTRILSTELPSDEHLGDQGDTGVYLFKKTLAEKAPQHLFSLLDGLEVEYFRMMASLHGPLLKTNYASVEYDLQKASLSSIRQKEKQQRAIMDVVRFDPAYQIKFRSSESGLPVPTSGGPYEQNNIQFPCIEPGVIHSTNTSGDGSCFLSAGFSKPEDKFTWALEKAVIDFALRDMRNLENFEFYLDLEISAPLISLNNRPQYLTSAFNGMVIGYTPVTREKQKLRISLPIFRLPSGNKFRVELTPDNYSPYISSNGQVLDERNLSFQLFTICLIKKPAFDIPVIAVDNQINLQHGSAFRSVLAHGFYPSEELFTWMSGDKATLMFGIDDPLAASRLRMRLVSRNSLVDNSPQELTVVINKSVPSKYRLAEGEITIVVDMPDIIYSREFITIDLSIRHAEAVFDNAHQITDPRLLGMALVSFSVLSGNKDDVDSVF